MLRKISITTLMAEIIKLVETNTGKRFYDAVPLNAPEVDYSSVKIHSLIQQLEEALTNNLTLDDPYNVIRVIDNGVRVIKTDETGEKHAICPVSFEISYGFICK